MFAKLSLGKENYCEGEKGTAIGCYEQHSHLIHCNKYKRTRLTQRASVQVFQMGSDSHTLCTKLGSNPTGQNTINVVLYIKNRHLSAPIHISQ
jgi:hypothetical protein